MSTIVPTRRALRNTRTATAKDAENANARPSRINTRAKPPSSSSNNSGATYGVVNRATGATAASRAKNSVNGDPKSDHPASKRKREALGEVTSLVANNKLGGKGKSKEISQKFDGVVINKSKTIRQPLRTVASTRQSTTSTIVASNEPLGKITESDVLDDNAMAVDPPPRSILPALTIPKSLANIRDIPHSRSSARRSAHQEPNDELEAERVFKKARTSSDAPEDAVQEQWADQHDIDGLDTLEEEDAEADPDGPDWEDLDQEDGDDPVMVSEYVVEIFEYFKNIEVQTMPNPNYMANQKDLGWTMRGILFDWLIELQERFRLLPETLFLCMNIVDRFLSARVVSLARLQLVGVTCMFIAAKVEEIVCPSAEELLAQTEASYSVADVFGAERYVLKTLNWNLNYANPVHFLRRVSKADDYNVKARTIAKYLLEIACLEWRLIAAPPSLLAAAAMWLARISLGSEIWTPNLAHYSTYSESVLIPTANLLLNYILKPIKHESFYRKYARRKYMKVSVFMRRWAMNRWQEGTTVNLKAELPVLKADCWEQRAQNGFIDDADDEELVVAKQVLGLRTK
ncbi:cyclin-like protein [Lentinula aciculospora]|uniref:Cyclin-like protein n=1 Tax=Lentinula aciculospora TaxID=153920 RepID=A0A9W8ZWF9_9AGAR|nr:cyclin-like protein [Lentinula aciculospora]